MPKTKKELAGYFDHTLLSPAASDAQIRDLCNQALEYEFASVCVNARWVDLCVELLDGSGVVVCAVTGFPLGADYPRAKAFNAELAIASGAGEIDMVADLMAIVSGDEAYLLNDIRTVLKVCHSVRPFVGLKVIIESAALTDEQIVFACRIAERAGADFVKTSTGFHPAGGATVEHVRLMAQSASQCRVKASGGIKTVEDALAMIEAGASRIGASKSVEIIDSFGASRLQS